MATKQTKISFSERKKRNCRIKAASAEEKENNDAGGIRSRLRHADKSRTPSQLSTVESESVDSSSSENESDSGIECKPASAPLTPSKRKTKCDKGPDSPPKMTCSNKHLTPSTHLNGLSLNSPSGAQEGLKRSESLPPKELFPDSNDELRKARVALHTHAVCSLPGREEELSQLNNFIKEHLNSGASGSLYVSGPPGTGKTACLLKVSEQPEIKGRFTVVYVNCTSMKSATALYSCVATQLKLKVQRRSEKACLQAIEKYLHSNHKMTLMILDEMDQLGSRGQSVLYTVFEWPASFRDGLMLVGISNALDLTDRTLPRLKGRLELAPQLLHFAPYSKEQLLNIITDRLNQAGTGHVLSAPALRLVSTKVATVSGDVRKALDIVRRVVELNGQKQQEEQHGQLAHVNYESTVSSPRKSPRKPMAVIASPHKGTNSPQKSFLGVSRQRSSPCKSLFQTKSTGCKNPTSPSKYISSPKKDTLQSEKKVPSPRKASCVVGLLSEPVAVKAACVDLKGVMFVVNEVYGTSHALGRSGDGSGEELPLQQKLAICSLLLILQKGKNKDVSVGKLHQVYRRVCTKRRIDPLDQAGFLSMLGLVEARGLLHIQGKGRPGRLAKVCLQWVEDEVVAALKDRDLLASIMSDVACLS